MAIVERHHSPDGLLELLVDVDDTDDWAVGFAGFEWHTHGDMLRCEHDGSAESAVRRFVEEVLESNRTIVVSTVNGTIRDVWIDDELGEDDLKSTLPNETIQKRYWNGTVC